LKHGYIRIEHTPILRIGFAAPHWCVRDFHASTQCENLYSHFE
jgi:hypothetical protein